MSRPEGEYVELREVSQDSAEQTLYPAAAAYSAPQTQTPAYAPVNTVVPPTPTIGQLEEKFRERRVDFNSKRYISDGWDFARHNCCSIFTIAVTWCLIFLFLHLAALFLIGRPHELDGTDDQDGGQGLNPVFTAHRFQHFQHARHMLANFMDNGEDGGATSNGNDSDSEDNGKKIAWIVFFVLQCLLIESPLQSSLFQATFNAMRTNTRLKWKDSFSCFNGNYYFKLMPLTIFLGIGYLVGYHLFILPGIWFTIISLFARPLHLEHQPISSCKAIKMSFKATRKYFWNILCFGILLILFNFLGVLALGVGVLITLPVSFFALCYCYHSLVGVNGVPYLAVEPVVLGTVAPIASSTPTVTHTPAPVPTPTSTAYPQVPPIASPAVSPINYAYPTIASTPAPVQQYSPATYMPATTTASPPTSAHTQNLFFAAYPVIGQSNYRPSAPSSAPTTFVGARS